MADTLKLGNFTFEVDDLPEEIPLGGEYTLAVFKYPGGRKEVQAFGAQDSNPSWTGMFNYNALDKVRALDKMYRSGTVYPLNIGSLTTRYVVIRKFIWHYRSAAQIPYEIELELAPKQSIIVPTASTTTAAKATTSPKQADAPAKQKTYVVKKGDSLWKIAAMPQFYKDGSQWRKIATANKIKNPDNLKIGQKLVIP